MLILIASVLRTPRWHLFGIVEVGEGQHGTAAMSLLAVVLVLAFSISSQVYGHGERVIIKAD